MAASFRRCITDIDQLFVATGDSRLGARGSWLRAGCLVTCRWGPGQWPRPTGLKLDSYGMRSRDPATWLPYKMRDRLTETGNPFISKLGTLAVCFGYSRLNEEIGPEAFPDFVIGQSYIHYAGVCMRATLGPPSEHAEPHFSYNWCHGARHGHSCLLSAAWLSILGDHSDRIGGNRRWRDVIQKRWA